MEGPVDLNEEVVMRTQACREKIHKSAEACGLSPETVAEIDRIAGFVKENPQLCGLPTDAVKPLIAIPDKEKRQEAISIVENRLNRKTPTGGIITKRLSKPEVEKIIKTVLPPEKEKENPTMEIAPIPAPMKDVLKRGVAVPTAVAPPKSQAQIRKERAEMLDSAVTAMLDLMPSVKSRNTIKETLEMYEQFDSQADVISMALDYFEKGWKPRNK